MTEHAVLVGVGQLRRKPGLDVPEPDWEPIEPTAIVAQALARAAEDAGRPSLLHEADGIGWVPAVSWGYEDAPASLARALGRPAAATGWACPAGGDGGVQVLNDAANRIAAGELKIALLGGCEVLYSRRRALKQGIDLEQRWTPGGSRIRFDAKLPPFATPLEVRHGIRMPVEAYPLLENALRAEAGRSIEAHQRFLGQLYAGYSEVAATNPYSWFPGPRSADDIRRVHPKNRWVGFPYPKNMNAIMEVDQAAAVIVMAASEAERLGIPPERRVAFLGGGRAVDGWTATQRAFLTRSPAYEAATREALAHARLGLGDVDLFDLYSCFPCAVQLAMKALGLALGDPRGLTQTGGLAHHGGPGNAYSLHGICNTVNALRARPNSVGWVSGLGMTATKHAICALSNDPRRVAASDGQASEVLLPKALREVPPLEDRASGPAAVQSYTVTFDREGKSTRTIYLLALPNGRRTLANGPNTSDEVRRLTESEGVGQAGVVTAGEGDAPNSFALA